MDAPAALTRRSVLQAGAGAFAALALRPAGALAARGPVRRLELGTLRGARSIVFPPGVAVVGLQSAGAPAAAKPQLRVLLADGRWGPWVSALAHGHGPEAQDASSVSRSGEPLWVGGARRAELRSAAPLADARLLLVSGAGAGGGAARAAAASLPQAQPVLAAGAGQ
ncbi:MAG: hypothetical protein ACYDC2_12160, partial [Solirubrobacteraceae bacterium]